MGVRRDLEENYDFEIVDEFLDHYAMMVEIMEPLIIDLSVEERYARALDELFRIFHNIKSASSFLKIETMVRLSTFVEDSLEKMRYLDGPANDEVITWLVAVNDMFIQWQEDLKMDSAMSKISFSLLKLPDMETI
ncbi:chemotaxis protein CheA [Sulfurimonas sp. MAG313]|nr:chemotaxis protein CheA [Sulfurimonas sp. MAG313]MDF1882075.1 chemotaxis protein CheA [Sulfurimonas sp. MAG313]